MLNQGGWILNLQVREGVRAALITHQQRIALRIITGVLGGRQDFYQSPVGILAVARGNPLGNNRAAGVLADVDHLGAGVGLLIIAGHGDRVELADGVFAAQDAAWIFPGNRRSGFHLRPGDFGIVAFAQTALGDEVINAALAVLVARIPVLHRGVFNRRIVPVSYTHLETCSLQCGASP